jgi:hypothetical protein
MDTQQQDYNPIQQLVLLQLLLQHHRSQTVLSCKERWMKLPVSNHSYLEWKQQ